MARTKKTEAKKTSEEIQKKPVDFGSGMTRINNMLQAGYTIKEIKGVKRNE